MRTRIALGAIGLLGILFGGINLMVHSDQSNPVHLGIWLAASAMANDVILIPAVGLVGLAVTRWVPARARALLQGGLVTAALTTAIAIPLIYRRGTAPAAKTLEVQNYGANLAVILAIIAGVTAALIVSSYLRAGRSAEKDRPANDHSPIT